MSITVRQAEDLLSANYGSHWFDGDPDWWQDMVEHLTTDYRSVQELRRKDPGWLVPPWWPGATPEQPERIQGLG